MKNRLQELEKETKHICTYGVYIDYNGYTAEVYKLIAEVYKLDVHMNTDFFNYCPYCGKELETRKE